MRYRVTAIRHRGQRWESKWHFDLEKAAEQARRWRERHPELIALGIEDERKRQVPVPVVRDDQPVSGTAGS
jgi:hypothetical protein